jgi:methylmalonyl-CoA/ethylmalonyl-CoA epimerase
MTLSDRIPLDHVALVVSSLEPVLQQLDHIAGEVGPIESFPSEGTREVYVGESAAKLLLMEPTSAEGPYARALEKRGPGLHHVALNTPDLDAFLSDVRGWLLLPTSVQTIAKSRTAWLARPGVSTLLEVHEAEPTGGDSLVSAIELPGPIAQLHPSAGLTPSPNSEVWLTIRGRRMSASALASATI